MRNYITESQNSIRGNSGQNIEDLGFTVFGDPVSKERPRTVRSVDRHGRVTVHTYTPSKTKDNEDKIALVYKSIYGGFKFDREAQLLVSISFFMKIPKSTSKADRQKMMAGEIRPTVKKHDIDNLEKLVLDGLNGVAYEDDSQIVELIGKKYYSNEPRIEIYVARIENDE